MLEVIVYIAFAVVSVLLAVMARQLIASLKRFAPPTWHSPLGKEVDLPSVTVCIPARNEQHALAYCLEKVIASEYDKLEIIVLDDVSGDDTSALIKSFASEGVRFVKGAALPEGWLGKNHALQGLLKEASGTYVLFMDVDTRLSPMAIENTVRYAISHRAAMVSVLPRREDGWRLSVLFSPLRYFWELVFSRKLSPASSSNAWMIRRTVFESRFGGFETFKNAIQPEAKIADALAVDGSYKFLVSSARFGVGYEKKWQSQLVTSVRLLYPLLGNQVALAVMAIADLLLLLVPFVVLLSGLFTGFGMIHVVASVLCAASGLLYGLYAYHVWRHGWLMAVVLWPIIVLQEACLVVASVFQYKRKTVTWKGRVIRPEARN